MLRRWLAALALVLSASSLGFLPPAWADVAIPALTSRVTDLTGTLTPDQVSALEQRLAAFEKQKGSQMAVLMLPSTKPEAIEQFSIRLAEAWKIGRKGTDDGLILVIAKEDRRLRVEVGYGLEGVIPDAVANRVISETITPRFKAGDFYGGITAGVEQLIKLIEGEKLPPPSASGAQRSLGSDPFEHVVPAFVLVFILGLVFRGLFGRFPGALATAGVMGVIAWFFYSMGVALIASLVAFIFTLINTGRGGRGIGGFSTGGGGFSSGGGGFSGGGGSFGGGGSSGSW
jgi:uncharacterized protein